MVTRALSLSTDAVASAATRRPDHVAVDLLDDAGRPAATWTWGRLSAAVDETAASLAAGGTTTGSIVPLCTTHPMDATRTLFACDRLGAVFAPLHPRLTPDARAAAMARLEAAAAGGATEGGGADGSSAGHDAGPLPAPGDAAWGPVLDAWRDGGVPTSLSRDAWVLFTSGTTGRSKAAVLTRANLVASAMASALRLGVDPADRWLACMPLYHVGGLSILWRSAWMATSVVALPRFTLDGVARALADEQITLLSVVPTMLVRMLRAGVAPGPRLRAVLVGGGPATADLLREARDAGWPVCPTYGLTEAASQVATLPPGAPQAALATVGPPLAGTQVRIRDVGVDGVGAIEVRGPTVMRGYLDEPPGAAPAIVDGWLQTGDLGRFVGSRLAIVTRRTDLVVTGGENVYPAQVEAQLGRAPGVDDVLVVGVDDPEWGQRVACLVVTEREPAALIADLEAFARGRLAPHQRPREYRVVDALPTTPIGKVDRRAAARLFATNDASPPDAS